MGPRAVASADDVWGDGMSAADMITSGSRWIPAGDPEACTSREQLELLSPISHCVVVSHVVDDTIFFRRSLGRRAWPITSLSAQEFASRFVAFDDEPQLIKYLAALDGVTS